MNSYSNTNYKTDFDDKSNLISFKENFTFKKLEIPYSEEILNSYIDIIFNSVNIFIIILFILI